MLRKERRKLKKVLLLLALFAAPTMAVFTLTVIRSVRKTFYCHTGSYGGTGATDNLPGGPEPDGKRILLAWLSGRGWEPCHEDEGFEDLLLLRRGAEKRLWSAALASELLKDIEAGRKPDDLTDLIPAPRPAPRFGLLRRTKT
jgi:hypothetical protein